MKAGYKIRHSLLENANFIILAHYPMSRNLIATYGFSSKKEMLKAKDEFDIGFWRIKRK